MAVQPTREDALDTGTLNQYAHLYDVERLRQDIDTGEHGTASDGDKYGVVKGSDSITVEDGVAKVNPGIFGDGVKVEDGQVTFDIDWFIDTFGLKRVLYAVGENLIIGQNNKIAPEPITSYSGAFTVVRVRNDSHYLGFYNGDLGVDDAGLGEHFAGDALYYDSAQGLMVKVGEGLHIQNDEIDIDQDKLPLASATNRGTVKVGSGLAIDAEGVLSATGGSAGGYPQLSNVTLKTTERAGGIANGEDDVDTTDGLLCPVFEKDGTLYMTSASATRTLDTTYTAGTNIHIEFDYSVGDARVDPSLLSYLIVSFAGRVYTLGATFKKVNGRSYLSVNISNSFDVKAGTKVTVKFF